MERSQDFLTHELDIWRPWTLVPRPVRIGRVFPRRDFFWWYTIVLKEGP